MGSILNKHEFAFKLIPVGIGYRCESCHEGEMYPDDNGVVTVPLGNGSFMRDHKCTKCGCKMKLPKTYPYIEWLKEEEYNEFLSTEGYAEDAINRFMSAPKVEDWNCADARNKLKEELQFREILTGIPCQQEE